MNKTNIRKLPPLGRLAIGIAALASVIYGIHKWDKHDAKNYAQERAQESLQGQRYAMFNLSYNDGIKPGIIVDENADGNVDFIGDFESMPMQDKHTVYFVREKGFIPESGNFRAYGDERVMSEEVRQEANKALENQFKLNKSLDSIL